MKTDDKFLLIGLGALLLLYLSSYTIPNAIIVINILILIGGISIASSAIIRMRNTLKWFKSDEDSNKTKEND